MSIIFIIGHIADRNESVLTPPLYHVPHSLTEEMKEKCLVNVNFVIVAVL